MAKYDTKASQPRVRGFAETGREATTLELVPEQSSSAPAAEGGIAADGARAAP